MIKIGLHVLPGPHTPALLAMTGRLAKAGHPVPGLTVVNDWQFANDAKRASPQTTVIYRFEDNSNPTDSTPGSMFFDHRWGELQKADLADFYQFDCEWWPASIQTLVNYNMGLLDAAEPHGIKVAVANIPVGHVEPGDLPILLPLFRRIAVNRHVLDYHAYDSSVLPQGDQDMSFQAQWYDMRWVDWAKAVPEMDFVFAECGNNDANFLGDDQELKLMQQFNGMLQPWPRAKRGHWWTFGGQGQGWARSSIDSILGKYEAWLMGGDTAGVSDPAGFNDLVQAASKLDDSIEVVVIPQVEPRIEYVISMAQERPALNAAPQPPTDHLTSMKVITQGQNLRVRAAPSPTGKVLPGDGLAPNTQVAAVQGSTVKAADGSGWIMIVRPEQGWVSTAWVK